MSIHRFDKPFSSGEPFHMKRIIFLIAGTTFVILAMWIFPMTKRTDEPISVTVVSPEIKNIHDYIKVDGRIKEGKKNNVYFEKNCVVEKVYVTVGDYVERGEVIADITSTDIELEENIFDNIQPEDIISIFNENVNLYEYPEIISHTFKTSTENSQIVSPMSGVVTELGLIEGENMSTLKKAFCVSDFSNLYIEIMIPEEHSLKIKEKDDVEFSAQAFGDKKYSGKIKSISPTAKYIPSLIGEGKTYVGAIAEIKEGDNSLRPGLSVNTKIKIKTIEDALVLPYECILQDTDNKEYVFCIKNNSTEKRVITTGHEMSDGVEIKSGITKDDVVIINPEKGLEDKTRIKEIKKID